MKAKVPPVVVPGTGTGLLRGQSFTGGSGPQRSSSSLECGLHQQLQRPHAGGTCQKSKVSGLPSDPLNEKLWGWGPAICILTSPPGDSDGHSLLKSCPG